MHRLLRSSALVALICVCLGGQALAWSPELPVVQPITSASSPSLAAGPDGRVHLVAAIQLPGQSSQHIYYTYWNGTGWASLEDLPGPNNKEQQCHIAVDAANRVHVVGIYRPGASGTSTPYTVFYWQHDGAHWSGPEMLSSGVGDDGNSATSPRICTDRFGDVHVIWSQDGMKGGEGDILYRKRQSGVWQPVQNITNNSPGTSYGSVSPDLAVDASGATLHVVWHDDFLNNGFQAYYTRNTNLGDAGAWLSPSQWFQLSSGPYQKAPRIWLDGQDRPHCVWVDKLGGETNKHVYRRHTGTIWSPIQNWGAWDVVDMAFDDTGVARLAYIDTAAGELFYSTYDSAANTHSAPQLVSAGAGTMKVDAAAMCLDAQGAAWMAWEERKGEWPGTSTLLFSTNYSAGAPADVVSFSAQAGNGLVRLYWTNPGSPNYSGTMVRVRADRFPATPLDGDLVVDRFSAPGMSDSYTHSGLTNGASYFYTAFAHDASGHYASGVTASADPHALSCGDIKLLPDGALLDLTGQVVSAAFTESGALYVQDPARSSGVRVLSASPGQFSPGDIVSVSGAMGTRMLSGAPAERQIRDAAIVKAGTGQTPIPLAMRGASVGGEGIPPYTPGVLGGVGLNNGGLLVRVCGSVTAVSGSVFYVDDGSGVVDPSGNMGVLVIGPSYPAPVQTGDLVCAVGIVEGSVPAGSAGSRRAIHCRAGADVTKL